MSVQFDALVAAVAANTSVTESAIELLNGLTAKINQLIADGAGSVNPTALQNLADEIAAETQRLADSVVANTAAPVADPVDPPPTDAVIID